MVPYSVIIMLHTSKQITLQIIFALLIAQGFGATIQLKYSLEPVPSAQFQLLRIIDGITHQQYCVQECLTRADTEGFSKEQCRSYHYDSGTDSCKFGTINLGAGNTGETLHIVKAEKC